MIHIRFCET